MSATIVALLTDLQSRGIELSTEFDRLIVHGPSDAMDTVTYQQLTYYKEDLIAAINMRPRGPVSAMPAEARSPPHAVRARCGSTVVELLRDGPNRWFMFAGTSALLNRVRNFASPFLDHAQRTAESWYGSTIDGWREVSR